MCQHHSVILKIYYFDETFLNTNVKLYRIKMANYMIVEVKNI